MEKGRHPHVIRTWTVERTRLPFRTPQPLKPANPRQGQRGPQKPAPPHAPVPGPKSGQP
jgi:hypothetical protein